MPWRRIFVLGFAVSVMSCLAPTEIILVISTDVACAVVAQNGVAIALGVPGDDDSGVATKTYLCAGDGGVGSAVILPHSAVDQELGIRVTLGVDAAADECAPPNFSGCIVARRSLRFDPHTPLTLPIDLDEACVGVPCTPNSTCVSGACVDAGVECDGGSCGVEDGGGVVDAEPADAGTCQPITDVTVRSGTGTAPPRVAVTKNGWAVAWQTAQSGVELSEVSLVGTGSVITSPVDLVAAGLATTLGPLGSDGQSYAISFGNANQSSIRITQTDGTPLGSAVSLQGFQAGHFGMPTLGSMTYGTTFIGPPNANALLIAFTPTTSTSNDGNITPGGLADMTLVQGASDFYATSVDQTSTCVIYKCARQSTFACSPLPSPPSPCSGVRVAERSGKLSHVALSNNLMTIDGTYSVNTIVSGAQFQLVAASDKFHIVFVTGSQSLATVTYDGTSPPSLPAQFLAQGTVGGIDAVADGPNSTGYAIAFAVTDPTAITSVHFMHLCL